MRSLENRLHRIERRFEGAGGSGELAPPVSDEHRIVRDRLRAVEEEYAATQEDRLLDEWLDLAEADAWLSASGELSHSVQETLEALV